MTAHVPGLQPTLVVGVGASAGGLEALTEMLGHAAADPQICYVVALHLAPDYRSLMADLLSKQTALNVARATDGAVLQGNTVYVIEPGTALRCGEKLLQVEEYEQERQLLRPIDILFESLAQAWGAHAAAVILSGTGADGSRGARAVKEAGGLVIAQRPDTAAFSGMPNALIATGVTDLVLRPAEICDEVCELLSSGALGSAPDGLSRDDVLFDRILAALHRHTDVDFAHYKSSTVARRIERRRGVVRVMDFEAYADLLENDAAEAKRLCSELLIGVTQFFRDPETLEDLRAVLEDLVRSRDGKGPIRAWVAGCSTGEEAYTVAMVLSEVLSASGKVLDFKVFGTDVSDAALASAAAGRYSAASVADIPVHLRERYFERDTSGSFVAGALLRDHMLFSHHDLLRDPPFSNLDLITCRNVFIYMLPEAQLQLSRVFGFGLRRGGVLWMGPSETPSGAEELFELAVKKSHIYRATQGGRRSAPPPRPSRRGSLFPAAASPRAARPLLDAAFFLDLAEGLLQPYLIFDEQFELRFQSHAARLYLSFEEGAATLDVRRLLPREARLLVTSAVERHHAGHPEEVVFRSVMLSTNADHPTHTDLRVRRLKRQNGGETLTALFFEVASSTSFTELPAAFTTDAVQHRIDELEAELEAARLQLRATVAELDAAKDGLLRNNEELLASNAELHGMTQELQSVNEELHAVNTELQSKVEELSRTTADLDGVLASVDEGILVLDGDLRVRRFNQRATSYVRIVNNDTGRPLSHLSHSFYGVPILDDCASALRELKTIERLLFSEDGARVLFRAKPINAGGAQGTLVSFSDVSSLQTLEDTAQRLNEAIQQLDSPVVLLDTSGVITYANHCFCDLSRRDSAFLPGTSFFDLLVHQNHSEFNTALECVRAGRAWRGMSFLQLPTGDSLAEEVRLRPVLSKAGQVIGAARFSAPLESGGRPVRVLLIEDNPGDARLAEERLRADGVLIQFDWRQTAEDALANLEALSAEALPDLILLDLTLPGMSGKELLLELKKQPRFADIPVVILTFSRIDGDMSRARELGAAACLTKPVRADGFREVLGGLDGFSLSVVRYPRDLHRSQQNWT